MMTNDEKRAFQMISEYSYERKLTPKSSDFVSIDENMKRSNARVI